MAIKKSDVSWKTKEIVLTETEKKKLIELETLIDVSIANCYIPNGVLQVRVDEFSIDIEGRILDTLFRRYAVAGWRIRWHASISSSGIESEWIVLS